MAKWIIAAGIVACPVVGLGQTQQPKTGKWFIDDLWNRLSFSGSRTLGYQSYSFEGDVDTFSSLTNYGTGLQHFTDIGNLSITGNKVLGLLDFRATFTDNRFSDPEQQQYTLNYRKSGYDISYGTVQASLLNTNRFASYSRSLNGFVGGYKKGRFETRAITSTVRGAARTVTLEGNNTSGPYYLQGGRIIGGSIKVMVDGTELQQGIDFLLDVAIGSITFINRVISPTSTIVASYESYDINGSGGTIRGAGVSYDMGVAGKVGVSIQEQLVGSASTTNERIEQFQGFGPPGSQYPLNFEPIPSSIVITVDGIVRSFSPVDDGVSDFYLNATITSRVISRVSIPSTQTLQIRYIPKAVQSVNGNRHVTGFDWRVPVGTKSSGSSITYSKALGRMDGGTSGNADAIDMKLNNGKGSIRAGLRKIEPGFQTIEQTNFNRNEDVAEYGFDYYTKGFTSNLSTSNSLITSVTGSTPTFSRLVTNSLNFRYSDPSKNTETSSKSQTLTFGQTRYRTTDETSLNTISYSEQYRVKRFGLQYGVESQTGRGRVDGTMTGIGVNSYKTSISYGIGNNWSLIGSADKSYVHTDTKKSQGYDYSLRANLMQTGPWAGGVEYTTSDSGLLATLGGFLNGSSSGYGGGGFGGSGGSGVISTGQLKANRTSFNATHQAGENLTLGMTFATTKTLGATTSNSKADTLTFDASGKLNSTHQFYLSFMNVLSKFETNASGNNKSNVVSATLSGNPGKFWNYDFGASLLSSSGSSTSQDNVELRGNINYIWNSRSRVFANGTIDRTRGYLPQDNFEVVAGYSYNLWSGISLISKYSYRNLQNLDPATIGGAFRANGFSIELRFDLQGRH